MGIAVLIVADHVTLAEALAAQDDVRLVGTASSGSQAMAFASTRRVDVAVIDTGLVHEDAVALGRRLRRVRPQTRVVHLLEPGAGGTGSGAGNTGLPGANGDGFGSWVGKDDPMRVLLAAVRGAPQGRLRLPASARPLRAVPTPADPLDVLTSRRLEVLHALVDGLSRAAIGERLFLSRNTVRSHIQGLLGRLGAHSTLEAVAIARAAGMPTAHPVADRPALAAWRRAHLQAGRQPFWTAAAQHPMTRDGPPAGRGGP